MREIVTVQVGGFANFVGSHFWNFQDELLGLAGDPQSNVVFKNQQLSMDVLYRSGETMQGIPTYTPRLVSIDLQGSLGCVSARGALYTESSSAPSDVSTWSGNVSKHVSEPQKKNLFLQSLYEEDQNRGSRDTDTQNEIQDKDVVECLDKDVKYWTDFSKVHYHPQSLYELSGLYIDENEFNNYGAGKEAFSESLRGEEICERLRFFVEECDHPQGFQFVVDDSGGFSAIAADFLEYIADEYASIPVLLYSVKNSGSHGRLKSSWLRDLHDVISFSRLSSFSNLIVPVGLPLLSESKASKYLCIEEKPYYYSAVYAAALHSNSIPFRLEQFGAALDSSDVSGAMDVHGIVQVLLGQGRENSVAILDLAMPAPALTGKQDDETLLGNLQPLTPDVAENEEDTQAVESMNILGALGSGGSEASVSEVKNAIHSCYEQREIRPQFCQLSISRCPLPIPLPFPSIFSNRVGWRGELYKSPVSSSQRRSSLDVHSVPVATRLRSSSAVLPFMEKRLRNLQRYGISWGALGSDVVRSWGFAREELEDMREHLSKIVSAFRPEFGSASDSD